MGEPLYNLDGVADAMEVISDGEGIALSRRRITVSTSGVVPQLTPLGERTQAMLAISLHRRDRRAPGRAGAVEPQVPRSRS
jgi:23S rRNA (adenine2503-C2)-methyltransferase